MGSNNSRERREVIERDEISRREMERINSVMLEQYKQEKKEEMIKLKKFSIIHNPNMKIELVMQKILHKSFKFCNIILIFLLNKNNELEIMLFKQITDFKGKYFEFVLFFSLVDLKIENKIKLFKEEFKYVELIDNKLEIKFEKFNINILNYKIYTNLYKMFEISPLEYEKNMINNSILTEIPQENMSLQNITNEIPIVEAKLYYK